jgi:DNA-binding XRE family transcriptional regulator
MTFTTHFKEKVKPSETKMQLASKFGVSYYTIERWLKPEKHDALTKLENIKVLCEFFGLTLSEIFIFEHE